MTATMDPTGGRVVVFTSGGPTFGPGAVTEMTSTDEVCMKVDERASGE
jgi:hypothetical protein